jgi:hypothetical protein
MSFPTVNHGQAQENRFGEPRAFVGYEVRDPLGRKIGTAEGVFTNWDNEPEYVQVNLGFFGLRSVLIPVQLVAADTQQRVLELR